MPHTLFPRLIAHRFRGFHPLENSIAGLNAALDFGVNIIEFDIRVAKCGTPMVYHDEHAKDGHGKKRVLADIMARDYAATDGTFAHMPTLDALLEAIAAHPHKDCQILIDIKDAGFEREIHALVQLYRLAPRVVYVSWVPEALYAVAALDPDAKLCLSHWCKRPGPLVRSVHKVFTARDGHIPRPARQYVHGERSGWFIGGPLRGTLRELIARNGGSVCVPVDMVSANLVADYHADGIEVSAFSYVDTKKLQRHAEQMKIDLFFVDKKQVFVDLKG